ncbi:OmpA family protein [Vreelandella azerica]|uniref:OmpA family protein n=1 Tax=Vreelandella azerica TaxID=2732867 RepID=UPI001F4201F7|nr:OmpA family protein [Halomonas azerica]
MFFVLLLSFAEIDADKFRRIAGELSKAFGVQRDIEAMQIPKGTSAALDKFSPAVPDRTLLDEIRQRTMEEQSQLESMRQILEQQRRQQTRELAEEIRALLDETGNSEVTQVEVDGFRVVIRIEERGSFMSGSSNVTMSFATLLADMAAIFAGLPGTVAIEGHTDNVPIRTARFESNWDLSAMRAASVANVLLTDDELSPERILVQGFADTEPRASNDTPEGRAQNRRVEINIDLSEAIEQRGQRELDALRQAEEPQTGVSNNQEETFEILDDAAIRNGEEVIEPRSPLFPQ